MKEYFGIDYTRIFEKGAETCSQYDHSMGDSLKEYINIKIPEFIFDSKYKKIYVVGNYDRSQGISYKEKSDKMFNFKRPTFIINKDAIYVNCYPGIDYVFHYASLIKTALKLLEIEKEVITCFPTPKEIIREVKKSNISCIPKCKVAILGYVTGLNYLSNDLNWNGNGDFLWKKIDTNKLLIGCKHSYWGDIFGYVVSALAKMGFEKVIYVGKLGTLNEELIPNETIATGNKSMFLNGKIIEWNNIFKSVNEEAIKEGIHFTLPSIIQENKQWVDKMNGKINYVDPEIGHMANSANINNIEFSYLHIISDNLSKKYAEDLSNERKNEIIIKRKKLLKIIGKSLIEL